MVGRLGNDFQFKIVTADRDLGDTDSYSSVRIDGWNRVGNADVFYTSPKMRSLKEYKKIFNASDCDVIYLNSFFSPYVTIKPLLLRRLRLIPTKPVIVAPRGEFSSGALGLKNQKKGLYLLMAKALGLYGKVIWQASSEHEETDIRQYYRRGLHVMVAPDLPPAIHPAQKLLPKGEKMVGCLKILFLSRISRMKNLDGAIKMIKELRGEIHFNIYGPMEDKNYWAECEQIVKTLRENIVVKYCGSIAHDKVQDLMREYDILFLPTLGENFGHVILEAFCAGLPVLISDQTPWRNLETKGVGWDFSLESTHLFQAALQRCADMGKEEYKELSMRAMKYGRQVAQDENTVQQNRQLFYKAMDIINCCRGGLHV